MPRPPALCYPHLPVTGVWRETSNEWASPVFQKQDLFFFLIVTVWKNLVFQPGYKNTHFFPDSQRVGGRGGRSFSFLLQWPKMRKGMRRTGKHGARSVAMLPALGRGQWPDPQPISVLSSHFLLAASPHGWDSAPGVAASAFSLWEGQQHPFLRPGLPETTS